MDATNACCPHTPCEARGQIGQGHLGSHSRKAQRCIGHAWPHTFRAPTGPVFDRLRTTGAPVGLVVPWLAYGGPVQAMGAAWGGDERTRAAWWARSGRQGQAVPAYLVEQPRDGGQGPAEALRVKQQGGIGWRARAMMVKTRGGLGGAVSPPRALPLLRRLSARGRRGAARRPLLLGTDGWGASIRAMRATWRAPVHTGPGGRPRLRPGRPSCIAPGGQR